MTGARKYHVNQYSSSELTEHKVLAVVEEVAKD